MVTVMSWNMHRRNDAWEHLASLAGEHNVAAALLQEATRPAYVPENWFVHPPATDPERWRIAVPRSYRAPDGTVQPTQRSWASAVVGIDEPMVAREPTELHEVLDCEFAASHPGQFAVAEVALADGGQLTVVSLYGIWDTMAATGEKYVDASLHRAISDLAVVFEGRRARNVLVAGDLNLYSYSDGSVWGDLGMTVFSRLAAYGLEVIGPLRPEGEPRLERCPCPDPDCRHVQTYMHMSNPKSRPHQMDYFLATPALRERLTACWADPDSDWPSHSDHRAIFATFDL